ncbi:High-affinity nitrate transporter [Dillenia turbinata]|uniref:High-affinity nitrate transporter n=1 Tax=Dillenia turbinata TaxID=194707 RepID=A0AAN8V8L8_9MAGN
MEAHGLLVGAILLLCLTHTCYGVLFSTLPHTLVVNASPQQGQVLKAGEDKIEVTWQLNETFPAGTDSAYKSVKVKLCYAPISQKDRAWRKTDDNLSKDKTCQFTMVAEEYNDAVQTFQWTIQRDIPTASYFVRAYALDSQGTQLAYGQTTDGHKTINLFDIQGISGRHVSLDIASACFSAFSLLALLGFFFAERRKAKLSQNK